MASKGRGTSRTREKDREDSTEESQICKLLAELRKELLTAFQATAATIEAKIDQHDLQITGLQQAVDGIKETQKDTKAKLEILKRHDDELLDRVEQLEFDSKNLLEKMDDLEGRNRRNNLRVVGYPEVHKPADFAAHMEGLLKEIFGAETLSQHFVVERAHRTSPTPPQPGAPPRPILLKLMNFRDRDAILRMARQRGMINHDGSTLSFYPDYALNVQNARRAFDQCKRALRMHEVQYAVMFPAKLRIIWKEKTHFFIDPKRAADFITENIGAVPDQPRQYARHRGGRRRRRAADPSPDGAKGGQARPPTPTTPAPPEARPCIDSDTPDSLPGASNNG